jgi:CheY-like chemotaxis protein
MPLQSPSILLVDDDEAIRDSLGEFLREQGFSVATAANGSDAIRWLHERRPPSCVVLLDLMMPVMDGNEFLCAKQADAALSTIPVVIITAAGRSPETVRTPDIKDYVSKPFELPRLIAAIESCA